MDDQTFQAIDAAYNEHIAIVFRNQRLTPAQHLRFGTLEISPRTQFARPGNPEAAPGEHTGARRPAQLPLL